MAQVAVNSGERKARVAVGFVVPPTGAIGGPPASEAWFAERKKEVMDKLVRMFPDLEFAAHDIREPADVNRFLSEEGESIGYLLVVLNCIAGLVKPILYSSKPVVMIAETYGGAGEFLLEFARARKDGMPVVGSVVREVSADEVLRKVGLFKVIHKLRNSRVLFVVSPSERWLVELEYPLSVGVYTLVKGLQETLGVVPIVLDIREFVKKYYNKVGEKEARTLAEKWIEGAEKNLEQDAEEILKSAKLYVALKRAALDYRADAVAFDCIVLRNAGLIDAWPCLGYMELWNDGIVPVCEADPGSAAALLIMKHLAGIPGFVSDPSPDEIRGEVVYYHCYAPTRPKGPAAEACPYIIMSAHLGVKRASLHVKLPTGEVVTAVGFIPNERTLIVHTAKAVRNEFSEYACATKLVGVTDVKALVKNWNWRSGWHRVVFYGDWREDLRDLATLLKLRFIEEDRW